MSVDGLLFTTKKGQVSTSTTDTFIVEIGLVTTSRVYSVVGTRTLESTSVTWDSGPKGREVNEGGGGVGV